MKYGSLILEKKEYVYVKRILNISGYAENFETQKSLQRLSDELKIALVVDEEDVPEDVIGFNSTVVMFFEDGKERSIQLVSPSEKSKKEDEISILSPLGAALLGYSEGDTIEWDFPTGKQSLKIVEVTQDKKKKKLEVPI